jgi:hypothetical protein
MIYAKYFHKLFSTPLFKNMMWHIFTVFKADENKTEDENKENLIKFIEEIYMKNYKNIDFATNIIIAEGQNDLKEILRIKKKIGKS